MAFSKKISYKNLTRTDVIGIVDSAGQKVVEYTYGAWGDILTTTGTLANTIGQINPIRYRGYYYDSETGFYYLQSRYYDPVVQRFVNADGYVSTGQGILATNMYAYCGNNPVNLSDPTGCGWISNLVKTAKKFLKSFVKDYNAVTPKTTKKKSSKTVSTVSISDFKNSDGSYSLYSNNRDGSKVFTETISKVSVSGGLDINDGLGLSIEGDFITGGWKWKSGSVSLLDFFHAEAAAYVDIAATDLGFGAFASIYSPSFSTTINGHQIEIGLEIGSIGAKYSESGKKKQIQGGYFWGLTISWE